MELTGDGVADILSGCYSAHDAEPMAGYFWLLAGRKDGTVAKPETVKGTDGKPLVIPGHQDVIKSICTQPAAHDWDGDGDLDIMTGNFEGTYWLFLNDGTREKAAWNPVAVPVRGVGGPLKLPAAHSALCAVDFDGDGDTDIVSGSAEGGAYWAENTTGPKGEPAFGRFQQLLSAPKQEAENSDDMPPESAAPPSAPGSDTRIWAADVNGDGKLDLLIGDTHRFTLRAPGISAEEFKKRKAEWNLEMQSVQTAMAKAGEGSDPLPPDMVTKFHALHEKQATFLKNEASGFVWLMLGK